LLGKLSIKYKLAYQIYHLITRLHYRLEWLNNSDQQLMKKKTDDSKNSNKQKQLFNTLFADGSV